MNMFLAGELEFNANTYTAKVAGNSNVVIPAWMVGGDRWPDDGVRPQDQFSTP